MKNNIITGLGVFALLILFMALRPPAPPEIHYYYGSVRTTSPDGKIPYGPVRYSLVKRTVDPAQSLIREWVRQGEEVFVTTLRQTTSEKVFDVTDSLNAFSGTMTFAGERWRWDSWTYDIALRDGGKIVGTGSLKDKLLSTRKKFIGADGAAQALIVEELHQIGEGEFRTKVVESHYEKH
ncbi:MAG TPA: hypothetical protein PLX35_12015 [Cyclobacteriaceae bacterium]|nr:hypothetical protein [Cyclobacteriaceae bacterium]